jgi:hypothetical protein
MQLCHGEVTAEDAKVEGAVSKALDKAGAALKVGVQKNIKQLHSVHACLDVVQPHVGVSGISRRACNNPTGRGGKPAMRAALHSTRVGNSFAGCNSALDVAQRLVMVNGAVGKALGKAGAALQVGVAHTKHNGAMLILSYAPVKGRADGVDAVLGWVT